MSECKQKYIEWSSENGNYCGEYDDGRLIGTDAVNEFDGWEAAWSHQQAKIDELAEELSTTKQVLHNVIDMERAKKIELEKKIIKMQECGVDAIKKTLNEIYDACDEDETVAMLLDKIQELLK